MASPALAQGGGHRGRLEVGDPLVEHRGVQGITERRRDDPHAFEHLVVDLAVQRRGEVAVAVWVDLAGVVPDALGPGSQVGHLRQGLRRAVGWVEAPAACRILLQQLERRGHPAGRLAGVDEGRVQVEDHAADWSPARR